MDDPTILAHVTILEVRLRLVMHYLRDDGQGFRAVLGEYQVDHVGAHDFLRLVAEDAFEGGADENETILGIHDADGVEQEIQHVLERVGLQCVMHPRNEAWSWHHRTYRGTRHGRVQFCRAETYKDILARSAIDDCGLVSALRAQRVGAYRISRRPHLLNALVLTGTLLPFVLLL